MTVPFDRQAALALRPALRSRRLTTLFMKIAMLAVTRPHAIVDLEHAMSALIAGERLTRSE